MGDESPAATPPSTTVSGATAMTVTPWMSAAVVAAYATRALWVKLRSAAGQRKLLKSCQGEPSLEKEKDEIDSEVQEDENDSEVEVEDDAEVAAVKQDMMLKPILSDAGPMARSIEL